jgi:antibiotic biosynthesis monooxygenase (ABM) superfamily enzyme
LTCGSVQLVAGPLQLHHRSDPAGWLDSVESEEEVTMIARIWRGWTTPENADAYQRIVSEEVLPGIAGRNLDGYHGAYLLRRDLGGEVEFATIMLFDSLEQVRAFAGEDYEAAYVPPRARAVLARFDERSAHYETLLRPRTL